LVASALAAILSLSVWVSRLALMESMVIMLILIAWYLFLKVLEDKKYFYYWGAVIGLCFLAKYTTFPILIVFLIYLAVYKRQVFKNYRIYLSLLLALVIFSPVLIYNILLFQNTGHFDLQIAAFLNQDVPEWQTLTDKISGGPIDNFLAIGPGLLGAFSPASLTLLILAVFFSLVKWLKRKESSPFLLVLFLAFYFLLFIAIKSPPRFITLIFPFVVILIAYCLTAVWNNTDGVKNIFLGIGIALFFIYELFFSINTNLTIISYGLPNITFSMVRPFSSDFAVSKLDKYLTDELSGTTSAVIPQSGNNFLDEFIANRANKVDLSKTPAYTLFVYDTRLSEIVTLWLFERRFIYDAIPTTYSDDFMKLLDAKGQNTFNNYNIYYITGTTFAQWRQAYAVKTQSIELENRLISQGLEPDIIYNNSNVPIFKVYKFSF
jgi:hypothetical protein